MSNYEITWGEQEIAAVKECIRLECEYCAKGVKVMDPDMHPNDMNVYHTGTMRLGNRDIDVAFTPCKSRLIRRHFGLVTEPVADGQ